MTSETDNLPPTNTPAMFKGFVGLLASVVSWLGAHLPTLDDLVRAVPIYGGALVVLFTLVSIGLDIWKKWKHRNE